MWIVREFEKTNKNLPIFYKKFQIGKQIEKCELKISALGIFSIKINGRPIDDYFMPGWTNYNAYVHLCSYDLTRFLKKDNLLEVTLSDGWYTGRLGYTRESHVYGEKEALFAEIILSYKDGKREILVTDDTWKVGESNILTSSLFDGEKVDFTAPMLADLDALPHAKVCEKTVRFEPYMYETVKKIGEIKPTVLHNSGNVIRLDFKQNFAGFITFQAQGDKGSEITVKHAEVLNKDGTLYFENLRSVEATDKVILSGKKDVFDPKFTLHGFRYAEITVQGNAKISNLKGIVLSQELAYHGKFECSSEMINKIYQNAQWGQKGNFISIPTDCPQRDERLGWTGDAQVFCNSAMFNCDCNRFFDNYLKLIRTDILPDGKIPSFVPFFIPVSVSTAGVPGWADSICVIPYTHYLHYGNKQVLIDNLPYAVRHLEYYLSRTENGLLKLENPFGDWLAVKNFDDVEGINQCSLGLSALLISKMYTVLQDKTNAEKYAKIYEDAKRAFRENYMDETGKLVGDSQTIYALALSVGYVQAAEIKESFLKSIENADGKLTTGFIGVRHLLPALCEIGEADLAYKLMQETEYPSWGYTIRQGATTIWERWNGYTEENGFETPSMNSFNHYSLGSCVEWLYSHVLGIKISENAKITVSPVLNEALTFAKGEYRSKTGKIGVKWTRRGKEYRVIVKAEKGVKYECDFQGKEVVSIKTKGYCTRAVVR